MAAALASAWLAAAAAPAKTTFRIEGMTCGGCVAAVKIQLKQTDGVIAYDVSFEKAAAEISYDPAKTTPEKIAASIAKTGFPASVPGKEATVAAKTVTPKGDAALERVTLFQVPLMCPAVKGLGCGGKARPFMADLEKQPEIAEAWLNHPGTLLAVVWREPQKRSHAASVVGSLFQTKGLSVAALEGTALNDELQDFAVRARWYRGQDVNKLSEQEGAAFAERMAKRVEARAKLSPADASVLRADLRSFCVDMLLGRRDRETKALLALASKYLDAAQLKVYEGALREGFEPLAGESPS